MSLTSARNVTLDPQVSRNVTQFTCGRESCSCGTGQGRNSAQNHVGARDGGWGQNGDVTRQVFRLINLRHEQEHPQVARRFALVNEAVDEVVADIEEVWAEGEGALAQLLDLVLFGDFVSLHRAVQEGIDPGPVPILAEIKARLAEAG